MNKKELKTLIHMIRIYCQDIGIEFGIKKCAILIRNPNNRRNKTTKSGNHLDTW